MSLKINFPGIQAFQIDCTGYSLGLSSNIQSATLRGAKVHVPVKVSQQAMRFSVTFRSQYTYQVFQAAVRKYHLNVTGGDIAPCQITFVSPKVKDQRTGKTYPNLNNPNISVLGYPLELEGGANKFDFQPQVSLTFQLVRDLVSNTTNKFSNSTDLDNLVPSESLIQPGEGPTTTTGDEAGNDIDNSGSSAGGTYTGTLP